MSIWAYCFFLFLSQNFMQQSIHYSAQTFQCRFSSAYNLNSWNTVKSWSIRLNCAKKSSTEKYILMNKRKPMENSYGQGLARCCTFWQCSLTVIYSANKLFFQTAFGDSFKESVGQGLLSQGQLHMATVVLGEEMFSV